LRPYFGDIQRYSYQHFKKTESQISQVNEYYIECNKEQELSVDLALVEEAEADEMWSFVHDKSQQYWLWWMIDHNTGEPLAYTFGTREHANLDELRDILALNFDIGTIYTDGNPAYLDITESKVIQGKRNTQKIENKHLALRTWCSRLIRRSIRFSKSHQMHRIVVGLVINYWFFGVKFW